MKAVRIANLSRIIGGWHPESGDVLIADGRIGGPRLEPDTAVNAEFIRGDGLRLFPGFVDVHIHGAIGIDVNAADTEGLLEMAGFLARNGITAWVPTLVPDSDENYRRVIGEIDRLMEMQDGHAVAQAVGVHYEGVFANERMCGALRPEYFRKFTSGATSSGTTPSAQSGGHPSSNQEGRAASTPPKTGGELAELPRLKRGIHMMTFAPEIEGGVELAAELVRNGWIASIGHTRADVETLDAAFAAGARHMTHFFNAMTGVHHRDIGVAGWGLERDDVTFDIIADGVHVHPDMLKLACRTKTPDKVTLISDSVAPTGLGDGEFEIWGEKIAVENGRTRNERGSIAGSVITMHDAFLRMRSLGFSDWEVSKMASANPARLLGLDDSRGSIEVGKRADLVGVRPDGSIEFVMIGGEFVDLN